jgi:hypothetical protein
MKHSAAMNVKVGDKLVIDTRQNGLLWEVINIRFPIFIIREADTTLKAVTFDYHFLQRPTKAQMNAYNKRKEKYYAGDSNTRTSDTSRTRE